MSTGRIEHVHHYFGIHESLSALCLPKTQYFNVFWSVTLRQHRPSTVSKVHPHDSPFHTVKFKGDYTILCDLEAKI